MPKSMIALTAAERHRLDITLLDEACNRPVIDAARARALNIEEVARLARSYATSFNETTKQLQEASVLAQRDQKYKEHVRSGVSRDCFFLTFKSDASSLPVNQIQARLEIAGVKNEAYCSVRDELMKSQQEYRQALQEFKEIMSN